MKTYGCTNVQRSIILNSQKVETGTFLVVQWLRIHLPIQATRVRSLVRELRSHMQRSNEACTLQLLSPRATTRESECCNY